ncbi:hypothetical protein JW710_00545 [Candidatus Dojkabacteria bacterium]|nr:hypothetical protein [Candidatus Dojkabacteria bacterium]
MQQTFDKMTTAHHEERIARTLEPVFEHLAIATANAASSGEIGDESEFILRYIDWLKEKRKDSYQASEDDTSEDNPLVRYEETENGILAEHLISGVKITIPPKEANQRETVLGKAINKHLEPMREVERLGVADATSIFDEKFSELLSRAYDAGEG